MNTEMIEMSAAYVEFESFKISKDVHFQCFHGKPFYPLDPMRSLDCITVESIATALTRLPRFGGRTKRFYSVAEHSLYVAGRLSPKFQLGGLLHDAHEAFTGFGDIVGTIKPDFMEDIEGGIDEAIACKFGFRAEEMWMPQVAEADLYLLAQERHWLMEPHTIDVVWGDEVTAIPPDEKYDGMPTPMKAADVKESFETMLRKLLPKRR
jgi:hypothetical protein